MTHPTAETEVQWVADEVRRGLLEMLAQPRKGPDPATIDRLRRETIASLCADPTVASAKEDPDDPLGVIVTTRPAMLLRHVQISTPWEP